MNHNLYISFFWLISLFLFSGDSFYFVQYIFTMQQFNEEEVVIDIPNASVIFPKGFDAQIARVSI